MILDTEMANRTKTDVLIIGGGIAGTVAAITGKSFYLTKRFMLVRKESEAIDACSIPHVFGEAGTTSVIRASDDALKKMGITVRNDEIVSIDQDRRICKTGNGAEIWFDKLVLALGSVPKVPDWLQDVHLENVFTMSKDLHHIDNVVAKLHGCDEIAIVGGGFVGCEIGCQLAKAGKRVVIVEAQPYLLSEAFDADVASRVRTVLEHQGVEIKCGFEAHGVLGDSRATGVLLSDGSVLNADAVIVAAGYRPNTSIARQAGLHLGETGAIPVDQYMHSTNANILAVGDCAETRCFVTGRPNHIMLASIACAEARIAGINLYQLSGVMTFSGTVPIFCTWMGDSGFGAAGITEKTAIDMGFNVVTATYSDIDKHPRGLPGAHEQRVKLIVARNSGLILGGEVIGGASTGELVNQIGLAIQNRMTVNSLLIHQVGTHSQLTASPMDYPLIRAAQLIAQRSWTVSPACK